MPRDPQGAETRKYFPLTVTFGKHNLCHIETDAGAAAGQGVTICSVPRKHQAIAEAMVNAFNTIPPHAGEETKG